MRSPHLAELGASIEVVSVLGGVTTPGLLCRMSKIAACPVVRLHCWALLDLCKYTNLSTGSTRWCAEGMGHHYILWLNKEHSNAKLGQMLQSSASGVP